MKDRLTYEDTSMVVNALNYYSTWCLKYENEDFQKRFTDRVNNVIEKFEKLEEQIMKLRIKE